MSRNFELFVRANKEEELLATVEVSRMPANGSPPRPSLDALAQEELVKLVQRVFLSPNVEARGPVVFSGVDHGGGCSWVCGRASEALAAHASGLVCVVDANLRMPSLHRYFAAENHRGLTDAVRQSGSIRDFAQRLPWDNLWLIPCGSLGSDPYALLNSERLRSRLAGLRAEFDHILIDAPPVGLYTDAIVLGRIVSGVIMVLDSNSTRREVARKAKESLEAANVKVLGAVLNRRTFPIPEAVYKRL